MKFLILTNHSYMLWRFRKDLIQALQRHGEVVLGMPFVGHEQDFRDLGCRCIETDIDRRSVNPLKDAALLLAYRKILKAEKPDLVITYSIKPNIYGAWLCKQRKIPCCINIQGLGTAFQRAPVSAVAQTMYRIALSNAKAIFFENRSNADEFVRRGIVPADKPVILNGAGVDTGYFSRQSYPSEEDGIRFLYLGRIMREKGVEEFYAAAGALKKELGDRVRFDVVGFFEDDLEEQTMRLQEEGVLRYHGFQTDPRPFYAASHCVVLPSYHEGMSNVLLEAAASGRALIASDIPGCREAVEEGVTGFLCRKEDAESLRDSMERFLGLREEARRDMGLRGRAKMEKEFEKSAVVAETVARILA